MTRPITLQIGLEAARTALFLWVAIHVVLFFMPGPSFTVATAPFVPALVAGLIILDRRISHEVIFQANLGVHRTVAPLVAVTTALTLEFVALGLVG